MKTLQEKDTRMFLEKSEPELHVVFNRLILHGILDGKKYLEEFCKRIIKMKIQIWKRNGNLWQDI